MWPEYYFNLCVIFRLERNDDTDIRSLISFLVCVLSNVVGGRVMM